ncbi:sensor histidine kinase [Paenibacillus abyssi]|uniref:HAMP domain-containing protein n=1 Tax=Paenibacillus abyssi TaxID=1340531 RepID=A0A917D2S4_9BACL|nr:histidine kinase [Paenibacillus abyssi]GGG06094.1 hypothetical protein GCM10010916_23880 [Paenibacillus abyssi]
MWMKAKNACNSIRFKLMIGLLVIMLPIVSLLIYNNFYSMKVVRNQVAQSNSNLISLYMGQLDRNLEDIESILVELIAWDTRLLDLERSSHRNIDQYNLIKLSLFRTLLDKSVYIKAVDYFYVYTADNNDFMLIPRDSREEYRIFNQKQRMKSHMAGALQDQDKKDHYPSDQWTSVQIGNEYYLNRVIKTGNVYIGALVNVKNIMVPLNYLDIGADGRSLLVNERYQPLNDVAFIEENGIQLKYAGGTYSFTGAEHQYLVVGEKSGRGDFSLIALIPDRNILEKLPYLQRIIMFIVWGAVLYLAVSLLVLRRVVLAPINRIVVEMRKLKQGYFMARIADQPTSSEFELMNETFNSMASQIQQLKIDIYEEQLNNQKAELKHLHLQINPHFFLNSLNIVYYLARDKNFALIQELSLSLIQYFRFMFRSHSDVVPLQDEIKFTQNYLRIQEFRFPGNLTYRISAADSLRDCAVPPLVIQTFVENAIKYAINLDEPVHIDIIIEEIKQHLGRMKIRIQDTGGGFSEHILKQLQEDDKPFSDEGEKVGIWNVKQRLRLLYQDQADITFRNAPGAVVEINIPVNGPLQGR